jgi:hypothetical protein
VVDVTSGADDNRFHKSSVTRRELEYRVRHDFPPSVLVCMRVGLVGVNGRLRHAGR